MVGNVTEEIRLRIEVFTRDGTFGGQTELMYWEAMLSEDAPEPRFTTEFQILKNNKLARQAVNEMFGEKELADHRYHCRHRSQLSISSPQLSIVMGGCFKQCS